MRKGDGTMKTSVLNLLNKHKAGKGDNKAIRRYEKLCKPEMDQEFERLMEEVKQLEQQMSPLHALQQTPPKKTKKGLSERRSQKRFKYDANTGQIWRNYAAKKGTRKEK